MNRFFLHTEYFDHAPELDEDGALFKSVDAAKAEAGLGLWDLVSAAMRDRAHRVPRRIWVVDERGDEVGSVFARDLVPAQLRG